MRPNRKGLTKKQAFSMPEVVVSLTTFPSRIDCAHLAIESILRQTLLPSRIVLCLSRVEFPGGESGLPEPLRAMLSRDVEILWVDANLKAHKKYLYTMQKYPDAVVITIDDDKVYPPTFVSEMVASYRKFPTCVTAMHVHLMTLDGGDAFRPYAQWKKNCRYFIDTPNIALFPVGAGGVLYPPSILPAELFDTSAIIATCLDNDDIWLKAMEVVGDVSVVTPPCGDKAVTINGSQMVSLWSANEANNDGMIQRTFSYVRKFLGKSVAEVICNGQRLPDSAELRRMLDDGIASAEDRARIKKMLSDQKSRADKADADYAKLKTDLSAEIARHKEELAKLTAEKSAVDAAAAKQKTTLDAEVAKQKAALAAEQAKTKDFNAKLYAVRNELSTVKNEAFELRVNLDAERKISGEQTEQISVLKAALQFAANRRQNDQSETKLLEYSQEVRELRNALDAKRDEAVERAERLGLVTGQLESCQSEKNLLVARISELSQSKESLELELRHLKAEFESAKAATSSEVSRITSELEKSSKTVATLQSQVDESNSAANRYSAEAAALRDKLDACKRVQDEMSAAHARELQTVEQEKAALEESNSSLEERVGDLSAALDTSKQESSGLRFQLVEIKSSEERLSAEAMALRDELATCKHAQDEMSAAHARELQTVEQEKAALEESNSSLEERVGDLFAALDTSKEASARLQSQLSESKSAEERISQEVLALKAKAAESRNSQDELLALADEEVRKLETEKSVLEAERCNFGKEVDRLSKDLKASREMIESLQSQLDNAKSAENGLSIEVASLGEKLKKGQSQQSSLSAALKVAEDKASRLDAELKAAESKGREQAAEIKRISTEKDIAVRQISAQKAVTDTVKRDLANSANALSALERQHHELKLAKTKAVRLYNAKKAKFTELEGKYRKLANSKLGRLTLAWWRRKKRKSADCMQVCELSQTGTASHTVISVQEAHAANGFAKIEDSSNLPATVMQLPSLDANNFRVLFPCGTGNNPGANPFVGTLIESFRSLGAQVSYGADLLFAGTKHFDIVHFMWPEALFGWKHADLSEEMIEDLKNAIKRIKSSGTIVAYTRHNTRPHVDENPLLIKAYEIVEGSADLVFHMGEYSLNDFMALRRNVNAVNVIVPHHTYSRISRTVTKKEARDWFGLNENDKVVLSFGVFRSDAERDLLLTAVKGSNINNLKVLAPRFSENPPPEIICPSKGRPVPEQMVPMYFAAADVVFIQRCKILNSGNLPMAFFFGCACVGPDDGDVGEVLKATGNPVFNADKRGSASVAIVKAFAAIEKYNRGVKNRKFADENWSQDRVAGQIMAAYRSVYQAHMAAKQYKPMISVVIDTRGADEASHKNSLASLERQTYPSEFIEIINTEKLEEGMKGAKGELILFLLSGDELSPRFLECVRIPFEDHGVDCVVMRWRIAGLGASAKTQTYVEKIISRCAHDGAAVAANALPLSASLFGRVFRKCIFDRNVAMIKGLDDRSGRLPGDTVMESALSLRFVVMASDEYFIPSSELPIDFLLDQIDSVPEKLVDRNVQKRHKLAFMGRMQMLTDRLVSSINAKKRDERTNLRARVLKRETKNDFFNRSLFSSVKALAFCHNFPPAVDASSFVAAKRLREIDAQESLLLNWHVISQDMHAIRPLDLDFLRFYADSLSSCHIEVCGNFGFAPILQMPYVDAALLAAESIDAEIIYSRSFFIGSHIAAYKYKMSHPGVKWYAEFSDPVAYAVDNTVRSCPSKGLSWFETERMVYDQADVIIFTNEKQRAYMLDYNKSPELNARVMSRSIIMHQPVLDRKYCLITPYPYSVDVARINIGYFGTFYANRTSDDMLALLVNKRVVLHVFTTKYQEMAAALASFGNQVRVNPTVSHLEFLSLGTKFDYLFLNDASFMGGINPFLPSKFADYMATGTKIIAKVQDGSTLSESTYDKLIRVKDVTREFAESLRKINK